jgi:type VI secretion system protein VasJ
LLERFGAQLHPQRDRSRKAALEWLAGSRMTDSLSLYPEVVRRCDANHRALLLIAGLTENEPDETRPELNALYGALESRLQKAGAWMRWYRRTPVPAKPFTASHSDAPAIGRITSGQDLLAQARTLTEYLREQPDGWLSAHHLMKSLRHDTLRAIPARMRRGVHASSRQERISARYSNASTCSRTGLKCWKRPTAPFPRCQSPVAGFAVVSTRR